MEPIKMWGVADPKGKLLRHTFDTTKANAFENFRWASYPQADAKYWREKGYKPVEVVVYLKADADELTATIERMTGWYNEQGATLTRVELERRKLDAQVEFYRDELGKAQACADELAALSWKWKYKADCLRETIRRLVVAFRVTWIVLIVLGSYSGVYPKRLAAEIRLGLQQNGGE